MIIESRSNTVKKILVDVVALEVLVGKLDFAPEAISDMKDKAKDLCDAAKDEIDGMKDAIDEWG